jgi:hypothetical protein
MQAQVYIRVTVLTESRRRTYKSSGVQEGLADGRSKTAVTRVEWQGTRMEYATRGGSVVWASKLSGGRVYGFRTQNPGEGSEEERTVRGSIEEFASRRIYLMKGAVVVG